MSNRKISKIKIGELLLPCVSVIVVCLFPVVFMYAQNASEALLSDCLVPALWFCGCGLVLWLAECIVSKEPNKSALAAVLVMILFLNFTLIENLALRINYEVRYWHVLAVLVVISIQGTGLIFKKLPKGAGEMAVQILPLVFGILIVMNIGMAIPTLISRVNVEQEKREAQMYSEGSVEQNHPNIYYLIFDEYAGNNQIKKYYNYDNTPLTNKLEALGFNQSFSGHNDSIYTTTIVANLVNLDYFVDNTWEEYEKKNVIQSGKLFSLLRDEGYSLYEVVTNDWYGLPSLYENTSQNSAKTAGGDTLATILLKNTVWYPFVKMNPPTIDKPVSEMISFSKKHSNDSQFLIAHFDLPHTPFVYDRDGNFRSTYSNDWHDKSLYLEQYMYAGSVIEQLATGILRNDPDCILIIQSDHGARATTSPDLFMEMFELNDMNNFFNAVYFKGEKLDIEGLSSVNTMRTILNRLLGLNLDMLPVPMDTFKYK